MVERWECASLLASWPWARSRQTGHRGHPRPAVRPPLAVNTNTNLEPATYCLAPLTHKLHGCMQAHSWLTWLCHFLIKCSALKTRIVIHKVWLTVHGLVFLLKVLCWYQANDFSQWSGNEFCSCRAVKGKSGWLCHILCAGTCTVVSMLLHLSHQFPLWKK